MLDTAKGCGAAGLQVDVRAPDGEVTSMMLDTGGRASLLPNIIAGAYEILFHAGAYQNDKNFYDIIPVRFNVSDAAAHYHIPLILSPFGYSTYRGG